MASVDRLLVLFASPEAPLQPVVVVQNGDAFLLTDNHVQPSIGRFYQGTTNSGSHGSFLISNEGRNWFLNSQPCPIKITLDDITLEKSIPVDFLTNLA